MQGLVDHVGIRLHKPDEDRPKFGILARELDGKGREDELEVPPVLKIPGAEEGCTQAPLPGHPSRYRLCDGRLPRPRESVQPVDRRFIEVEGPELDLVQDSPASSLQTVVSVPMSMLGLFSVVKIVEDSCVVCRGVTIIRNNMKRLIS